MSALLELAERCEAATGPDREIDAAICRATKVCVEQPDGSWMRYLTDGYCHSMHPLNVTASIDAALTLVPEGRGYIYKRHGIKSAIRAQIESGDRTTFVQGDAATLALAICAAALRARAAQ
jgi:hypothetical protein